MYTIIFVNNHFNQIRLQDIQTTLIHSYIPITKPDRIRFKIAVLTKFIQSPSVQEYICAVDHAIAIITKTHASILNGINIK